MTRIFFTERPEDVERYAVAALTLESQSGTEQPGGLKVTFHTGHFHYDLWSRSLDASWRQSWDGSATIGFDQGEIYVLLGDDKILSALTSRSSGHGTYYAAVVPGGVFHRSSGRVTLKRVEAGWKTPPGMRALDRLHLSEEEDFSAQDYIDLLVQEILDNS